MEKENKYTEIFELKKMLEKENIPFDWVENFGSDEETLNELKRIAPDLISHYHLTYPCFGEGRWISVVEGFGMYGSEQDLLEIMESNGEVSGWHTAEFVFNKIKSHWDNRKENKNEQ